MIDIALLELADSERPRPTPFVRNVSQEPTRFGMVRLAIEHLAQTNCGVGIDRRFGLKSPLGQVKQLGRRLQADLPQFRRPVRIESLPPGLAGPLATLASPLLCEGHLGQRSHPAGTILRTGVRKPPTYLGTSLGRRITRKGSNQASHRLRLPFSIAPRCFQFGRDGSSVGAT